MAHERVQRRALVNIVINLKLHKKWEIYPAGQLLASQGYSMQLVCT